MVEKKVRLCPVCGTESVGGKVHGYHRNGSRTKGYTLDALQVMAIETQERNQVCMIVGEAVDLARQPDGWTSKPKRREYHRDYYWRNVNKRRAQRTASKAMQRRLRPLIADLCKAVDIGRITAGW